MAQSLDYYMGEVAKNYQPATEALNNQIGAVDTQLAASKENINRLYNQQQQTLENNRNAAAYSASMQAAGSGGSFGGSANIANRKYYEGTFVPAQTSLQTNQANAISDAESAANSSRLSLQQTLANMQAEMGNYATQRYDTAVEADRQEALARAQLEEQKRQADLQAALQREQMEMQRQIAEQQVAASKYAAQLAANASVEAARYYQAAASSSAATSTAKWGRGAEFGLDDAGGFYFYDANGLPITMQQYVDQTGENRDGILAKMAQNGDVNAIRARAGLNNARKQLTDEERAAFNVLGISTNGYGRRS